MVKQVFAVKDCLTGFLDPFCMSCERDAIHAFEAACHDPRCVISKSPKDYDLYLIGSWYPSTGEIEEWDSGIFVVARGAQFVKPDNTVDEYAAAMEQAINHFAESEGETDETV